jgi:hypothetical protein
MRRIVLAASVAAGAAMMAASAHATVFVLDSYTVTANIGNPSGNDGLTVDTQNILKIPKATKKNPGGLSIDLNSPAATAHDHSETLDLFKIDTPETSVNGDDLAPVDITVDFSFSSPSPNTGATVGGTTQGNLLLFGIFQNGSVTWNSEGVFNWTDPADGLLKPGVMDITLSNGSFDTGLLGPQGGAKAGYVVDATFAWQSDPSALRDVVPEPASWALMIGGFGMAGAMVRRRRAVATAA